MSVHPVQLATFKGGSTTYFNSSLFFPETVRDNVVRLYAFVRIADNYVDQVPQDIAGFISLRRKFEEAVGGHPSGDIIVDDFVKLSDEKSFDASWTTAFLHSMELDLTKTRYETIDETLDYIYGSAEVIGLFMAKILGLNDKAAHAARMQGRSMQMINFIRDIAEDNGLGRTYLPMSETSLPDLTENNARQSPDEFRRFLRAQIDRYLGWQSEASSGYRYIPQRSLIPVKTASDMYNWTARRIRRDPFVVFERKVKPRTSRIVFQVLYNWLSARGLEYYRKEPL